MFAGCSPGRTRSTIRFAVESRRRHDNLLRTFLQRRFAFEVAARFGGCKDSIIASVSSFSDSSTNATPLVITVSAFVTAGYCPRVSLKSSCRRRPGQGRLRPQRCSNRSLLVERRGFPRSIFRRATSKAFIGANSSTIPYLNATAAHCYCRRITSSALGRPIKRGQSARTACRQRVAKTELRTEPIRVTGSGTQDDNRMPYRFVTAARQAHESRQRSAWPIMND